MLTWERKGLGHTAISERVAKAGSGLVAAHDQAARQASGIQIDPAKLSRLQDAGLATQIHLNFISCGQIGS